MKIKYIILAVVLSACNDNVQNNRANHSSDTSEKIVESTPKEKDDLLTSPRSSAKTYSNERFKEVRVEKVGEHQFLVQGKGQIYEANFGWVVEDGHDELKKGFEMTDAGAPEWGNFEFTIEVQKERQNSTLTLFLYETSAKDGSRQYVLPIALK